MHHDDNQLPVQPQHILLVEVALLPLLLALQSQSHLLQRALLQSLANRQSACVL